MKVKDIFTLKQGNSLELMHLEVNELSNVNFISRTSQGNGVVAQVEAVDGITPFAPGLISVALSGNGVCSAFVQPKPFYTAFHIMVLSPKQEMTLQVKLFYCICIKRNAYKYCWGRQANKTLKDLELPDSIPEWVYNTPIEPIKTTIRPQAVALRPVEQWASFRIGDIFKIERCKNSSSGDLIDGDDCYYLGAKKSENGVMRRVVRDNSVVSRGNCIVFIGNGQGSVGYTNYMNDDFIGTADLTVGYNDNLNKYVGMFLVTLFDLERPKYSFGRKWSARIADTIVKIPAKDGSPDWAYMEQYIKSLPYSDRI